MKEFVYQINSTVYCREILEMIDINSKSYFNHLSGNNLYDDELVAELKRVANDPQERCQYILMERIRPPTFTNYFVRADHPHPVKAEMVSEMGVLGFISRFAAVLFYLFFFYLYLKACLPVSQLISWTSKGVEPGIFWVKKLPIWSYYPLYHSVTVDRLHATSMLNPTSKRA